VSVVDKRRRKQQRHRRRQRGRCVTYHLDILKMKFCYNQFYETFRDFKQSVGYFLKNYRYLGMNLTPCWKRIFNYFPTKLSQRKNELKMNTSHSSPPTPPPLPLRSTSTTRDHVHIYESSWQHFLCKPVLFEYTSIFLYIVAMLINVFEGTPRAPLPVPLLLTMVAHVLILSLYLQT
jgi:hypothetical protein